MKKNHLVVSIICLSSISIVAYLFIENDKQVLSGECPTTTSDIHQKSAQSSKYYKQISTKSSYNADLEKLRAELDAGLDVNGADKSGYQLLQKIIRTGDIDQIKLMLDRGADVNFTGRMGATPLAAAAGTGDLEIFKLILDHGAKINNDRYYSISSGETMTHVDYHENLEKIKTKGKNLSNFIKSGKASQDESVIAEKELSEVVSVYRKFKNDFLPLEQKIIWHSCLAQKTDVLKYLLEESGSYDYASKKWGSLDGKGIAHLVIEKKLDALKILADAGAKQEESEMRTAMILGIKSNNIEMVETLERMGATYDFNGKYGKNTHESLLVSLTESSPEFIECMEKKYKIDIATLGSKFEGMVTMYEHADANMVKYLINRGVTLPKKLPVFLECLSDDKLEILLKNEVKPGNVIGTDFGRAKKEMIQRLVDHGFNPLSAKDPLGRSLIKLAKEEKNTELVDYLQSLSSHK
ncbi:MAG: hypothetical protein RL095_2414 [Verrucomicrobiota bacterium]|jgi:ankyrin repeat protein